MKYPQLVSARAVNAISDWLVTRLEQLGVDAPLVYSRLLLSLLHTPLQLNALDLAEISDLKVNYFIVQFPLNIYKTFFLFILIFSLNQFNYFGRTGNRLSSSDTETLKRLAAIESLNDVVASDQHIYNIENLVDELCDKLREIENQSSVDDSHPIIKDSTELEIIKKVSLYYNEFKHCFK